METLKDMCELGECHFRNGAFKNAKDIYYRTMRISSTKFGALHPFSIRVQKNIHKCTEAVIRSDGLSNLEKHINSFFRMSSPSEPIEQIVRIDRLESLGEKLITRGKFGRAISIFKSLISLTLATALQDDEKAIQNISKYAGYLAGYGDLGEAEKTYRCVVQVRNRQNQTGDKNTELESAISDWAECLSQMGRTQSARETQELAEKISNS
jgi:tetratricopeptide (TPR) repeat protein